MSTINTIIPVKAVTLDTKKTSIVVRVLRQWTQKDRFNKETIEVLLADKEGSKIQATVPPNFARRFKPLLAENLVVMIKNFETIVNIVSTYQRAVINHPVKIVIIQPTKVQTCSIPDPIDENCFSFIPFSYFVGGEPIDENFAIDVIGEVMKPIGTTEQVPAAANSRKLDFKLMDHGGYVLDCTLWESYADRLIQQVEDSANERVILIIQFGKLTKWNNIVRVQSMRHATKIHFNQSIPEISDFLESKILGGPTQSRSLISNDAKSNVEEFFVASNVKTIKELTSCKEAGIYTVWAQIDYVDHEARWYYDACGNEKCTKGVEKGTKMGDICKKCNKTIPAIIPRYKLTVVVSDAELIEDGGYAKFVIFDRSAFELLKFSAAHVLTNVTKNGDKMDMPEEFDALIERQCLFRVEVDQKYNVIEKSMLYTVRKLIDEPILLKRFHILMGKVNDEVSSVNEYSGSTSINLSENNDTVGDSSNILKIRDTTPAKRLFEDIESVVELKNDLTQSSTTKLKSIKKEKL